MKTCYLFLAFIFPAKCLAQINELSEDPLFANLAMPGFASFYYESTTPLDTNVLFDADGRRVASGELKNGIPFGTWQSFHANGQIKWKGRIEAGFLVGDWSCHHVNGRLAAKGKMAKVMVELGCAGSENYTPLSYFHSQWHFYDFDGTLRQQTTYRNGSRNGAYTSFYINGEKAEEGAFKESIKHGTWKTYYSNGETKSIAQYAWRPDTCESDGEDENIDSPWFGYACRTGKWQWFDPTGKLLNEVIYD